MREDDNMEVCKKVDPMELATLDCKYWGEDPANIPLDAYCLPCADEV